MSSNPSSSFLMQRARLGLWLRTLFVVSIMVIASSVYAAPDSLDLTFPGGSGPNDWVMALGVQPDGKIVIGGYFTSVHGVPRNGIARLNANGTLDTTFDPGSGPNDGILALGVQPDGKIVIGGYFTSVHGVPRNGIARLNANGTLDTTFDPGSGTNDWVLALAVQPDGKIVVGGVFMEVNGVRRNHITRLNADGTLDTTFDGSSGADDWVNALAVQPDGKILLGGYFTTVNGVSSNGITRLNADGTLDTTFASGSGTNDGVMTIGVQPDGRIVIGGAFTSVHDVSRGRIARLNMNGTLDTTFASGSGANDIVWTVGVQPDGKIVLGGYFTSVHNGPRNYVTRLNADGTLDTTFASGNGADARVWTTGMQPDGKILIGGTFLTVNGTSRPHIARLQGVPDPPSPSPSPAPSGPRLFLSPATSVVAPSQTFQLTVRIDMAGKVADTVDAYLTYDPTALEVVDAAGNPATTITANTAVVSNVSYNRVNSTTGQIDFSASQYSSPYLTGTATVATIRFRAKTVLGTTPVRFVRQGIRRSDLFRGGVSVQAQVEHASVQIQAAAAPEADMRTRAPEPPAPSESPPGLAVRPAVQQIGVGDVIAVDLVAQLDRRTVATVDVDLMVDPRLVEIVDVAEQPIQNLRVRQVRGMHVAANVVDGGSGTAHLSLSRLRVPVHSGMLTLATVYLRAKQPFTTTPIRVRAIGQAYAGVTGPGQPLHLLATDGRLTMNDRGRIYVPQVMP